MVQVSSPPLQMDMQVVESPVDGVRLLLEGRATDLDGVISQLEAMVEEAMTQRSAVRAQLRRNEASRADMLADLRRQSPRGVHACFAEAGVLCAELGAVEERIAGLRLRIDGLVAEAAGLRRIAAQFAVLAGGDDGFDITADATRFSRAVRQIQTWVDADQDRIGAAVTSGPLQQLADAVVSVELSGKLVGDAAIDGAVDAIGRCARSVRAAQAELSTLLADLSPPSLSGGLAVSLRELVAKIPGGIGRFTAVGEDRPLRPSVELAALRIAQEAVLNAVTHGHPQRVDVVISFSASRVLIVVCDDGEGFDAVATEARLGRTDSFGLLAMRQRADLEGGRFEIRSSVGTGVEVRASFPVD